ncbi:MAG: HDOD domain-containing protein [Phycisphaeraceae bacterium]|nr:HDOD domain-containing protein [Phycisphaeraceae bacterium]MCW5761693.1 HDOD domain-containing protein [Phycisphaeraceae bacterium]
MPSEALERVLSCPSLPSLPAVAMQVLELTRNPDVSLRDIARAVEKDQALVGKILKTVNSSFYGLSQPCGTVDRALNFLGLNTVKSLVLGFSLIDTSRSIGEQPLFSLDDYWVRSIYAASGARVLAMQLRRADPDESFTAALFQDIGILASVTALGKQYTQVCAETGFDGDTLPTAEKAAFGFTHMEAGAALATKWRLPKPYVDVVQFHHSPDQASSASSAIVRTAVLGRLATDALRCESGANRVMREFEFLLGEWFGQTFKQVEGHFNEISLAAKEIGKIFNFVIQTPTNVSNLMAEAQERTIEIQIATEREAQTDALTGLPNRRRFEEQSEVLFKMASTTNSPLGVAFCDGDSFKKVNDTLGHQAGDEVLVQIASRLAEAVGEAGVVFRYGGEEFAVLLPGANLARSREIAERMRTAVCGTPMDLGAVENPVDHHSQTVSIGVASWEPGASHAPPSMSELIRRADEAVYKAKENGRNRVEMWVGPEKDGIEESCDSTGAITNVLLVEDDPLSATLWRTMLLKVPGVRVTLESGILGVHRLFKAGFSPDVVVTDYCLSSGSGTDVVRAVRELPNKRVPILVVSALLDDHRKAEGLMAGATMCVSKIDISKRFRWWIEQITKGDFSEAMAA